MGVAMVDGKSKGLIDQFSTDLIRLARDLASAKQTSQCATNTQVDFKSGHVIWRYRPLLVLLMSSDRLAGVWPAHPLHLALPFAPFGVGPAASSQLLGLDSASSGLAGH